MAVAAELVGEGDDAGCSADPCLGDDVGGACSVYLLTDNITVLVRRRPRPDDEWRRTTVVLDECAMPCAGVTGGEFCRGNDNFTGLLAALVMFLNAAKNERRPCLPCLPTSSPPKS